MDRHQEDPSMVLEENELRWAYDIKEAIDDSTHLAPVSDLECVQWAIATVDQQNLDEVLDKVHKLQCFREQYSFENVRAGSSPNAIDRCVKEGVELLSGYVRDQQPGHLVTIDHMASQGHYLIVWDRAKFSPSKVRSEADWRIYQGCTYNIFMILNSNVRAIREGIAVILECEGMGYLNYDNQFEERRVTELFNYYPFKTQEFFFLHTPTVAIFLWKAVNRFLTDKFKKSVKLDATVDGLDGKRIDSLFNMPTFEDAQDRLLIRLEEYLRERLEHQVHYKMPPKPPPVAEDDEAAEVAANGPIDDFAAAMASEFDDLEEEEEDEELALPEDLSVPMQETMVQDYEEEKKYELPAQATGAKDFVDGTAGGAPINDFAAAMAAEFEDELADCEEDDELEEEPIPKGPPNDGVAADAGQQDEFAAAMAAEFAAEFGEEFDEDDDDL
ncbi:expressed unknown protein [Seminavis robusta]|uniref:CRAL-TRIO domain-containing protein n=1 Tax=Seminavis robusta TaxID=568900 RepID=A0A9N8E0Y7_9STRA|nr:expressed unknown protein [Seminavis robusta]|eukprot:Sro538_g162600.1 n/a (443) ;mRNA; f:32817-34145